MFRLCLKGTDTAQLVATRVRDTGSEFLTLGVFFRSVAFFFQMQHAIGMCKGGLMDIFSFFGCIHIC